MQTSDGFPVTRRRFFERLVAAGGVSLAYDVLTGLGLAEAAPSVPFQLEGRVSGVRVAIVGAGLAGMTVAYELGRRGYECTVLEARGRPGGRVHTIRRGTVSEEEGPSQLCQFDEGQYFNCGPMRIAHDHTTTLDYCRELNVPLEVFAITADNQWIVQMKTPGLAGRRLRLREVRTDFDGYVAELLSKSVSAGSLDEVLTREDAERLLAHLKAIGRLDESGRYRGHEMRGPDAGTEDTPQFTPLPLSELLGSKTGGYLSLGHDYQPTMLQIVGGSDRLAQALAARLRGRIVYDAAVTRLRQQEAGVTVTYAIRGGRPRRLQADYLVCAIPLSVLRDIDNDLPGDLQAAIRAVPHSAAGKIGLQFRRRFWEEDDHIFGGAARTDQDIAQIVYPSHGFLSRKGVLVGYYIQGAAARPVGDLPPEARLALALEQGGRIHPQYAADFEQAFSVAWHRVPWSRGAWAQMPRELKARLQQPVGRVYFAGDHLNLNAWMQGAFESARHVARGIHARAMSR